MKLLLILLNLWGVFFPRFSPIPHIVWRKVDATDLPANHEISESGAALHLYNVQYEDVGGYECEAINTKGKDWHKAWVYVECESGALVSREFLLSSLSDN